MAKSATSFAKKVFEAPCPSCHSKDAIGKTRCPCGAQRRANGQVYFDGKDIEKPVAPVSEPVKSPVKTKTGSPSVSPLKKRSPSNGKKEPVKSPSKTRVEPVTEPVRARESSLSTYFYD